MKMKAVIYCRVSTTKQLDKSSLSSQEQLCRDYANSKGYKVISMFSEVGSGLSAGRPELLRLINMVEAEKLNYVICFSPDRISRNFTQFILFNNLLEKNNVQLHFTGFDNLSSENVIVGQLASFYHYSLSQKVKQALANKKRNRT